MASWQYVSLGGGRGTQPGQLVLIVSHNDSHMFRTGGMWTLADGMEGLGVGLILALGSLPRVSTPFWTLCHFSASWLSWCIVIINECIISNSQTESLQSFLVPQERADWGVGDAEQSCRRASCCLCSVIDPRPRVLCLFHDQKAVVRKTTCTHMWVPCLWWPLLPTLCPLPGTLPVLPNPADAPRAVQPCWFLGIIVAPCSILVADYFLMTILIMLIYFLFWCSFL